MIKIVLSLAISAAFVYGADILGLVGLLDRNDMATFQSRIQNMSDANSAREDNKKTILMYACWVGNFEAVQYLVSKGADVNAQDSGGATALHLAVWKGFTPIALYLIENGASGNAISQDGMTPLDIAMIKDNKSVIEALEKAAPKLKPLL